MKEQFCSYEMALKLKNLGFDEICLAHYLANGKLSYNNYDDIYWNTNGALWAEFRGDSNVCSAPTYQQIIDWFRKVKNIIIDLNPECENLWSFYLIGKGWNSTRKSNGSSYEENIEQAILKAMELCQKTS